ncbi:MAG: response regulator [Verrucomicrobia bacterium]|nr:response regulator [Verrucomicrobiota bacterium]
MLELVGRSAQRGADIVKQLLTFARGLEGKRVLLQPRHLIKEVAQIARETFPKFIRTETRLAQDLWAVTGDATQLQQVLINLCVNARDAMLNGGTLTLMAENVPLDESWVSMTPGLKPGPHVLWQVTDTGTGMPREIADRIFDPFFTTKEEAKGTGLGLSTVMGLVRSHGGVVHVESEVGRGTTFKVYLPAEPGASGAAGAPQESTRTMGQGELILVVDDEEPIRTMLEKTLVQAGYRAITAGHGVEALTSFVQHAGEIKAVLTDMVMPFMDGLALIRALQRLDPRVQVIASGGLGSDSAGRDLVEQLKSLGVTTFLTKPYRGEHLLLSLHRLLQGNGTG